MQAQPSREALLKEYELAHSRVDSSASLVWTSSGLIYTILTAGLLFVFQLSERASMHYIIAIPLASIGALLVLEWWGDMLERERFRQEVLYFRMGEIEAQLGMRKVRYLAVLDHANERLPVDRDVVVKARAYPYEACRTPPLAGGWRFLKNFVKLLMVAWALVSFSSFVRWQWESNLLDGSLGINIIYSGFIISFIFVKVLVGFGARFPSWSKQ